MYSNINTFEELCMIGCKFILNEIKTHPFLTIDQNRDNLYEMVGECSWIKDYLYKFNKLGFYTVMSQPGLTRTAKIYSTYLDYKKSFGDNGNKSVNQRDGTFGIKQRAEVEGFMKISQAIKLYEILKNDTRIRIGIGIGIGIKSSNLEKDNILLNGDKNSINKNSIDKYATLSFEAETNKIRFMEMEVETNKVIRTKFKGMDRDLKLSHLYHVVKRYFVVRTYPLKSHIPNLTDTDIVGVSIMDLEWNCNNYLWNKIYQSLLEIKNQQENCD
jgi:hypothetical protein